MRSPEQANASLSDRYLRPLALLSSVVALAAASPSPLEAAPSRTESSSMSNQEGLKDITELPGYGMEVSEEQRQLLEDATLTVYEHPDYYLKRDDPGDFLFCTAVKIALQGKKYLMGESRCFDSLTQRFSLRERIEAGAKDYYPTAKHSGIQYNIRDPKLAPHMYGLATVASVTGVAVNDAYLNSHALLKVQAQAPNKNPYLDRFEDGRNDTAGKARPFDQIPALDYKPALDPPAAGQEAAIFAVTDLRTRPFDIEPRTVQGKGVYLGRVNGFGFGFFDVVAQRLPEKGEEICTNYRHYKEYDDDRFGIHILYSGALGATALLADGTTLGPFFEGDDLDDPGFVERRWGIKLPEGKFNALCYYHAPVPTDTLAKLSAVFEPQSR